MKGVAFIHSCKVLHRDIKPQNILVNKLFEVKLADFGLGRTFSSELRPYSQEVVTLWYRAPELLIGTTQYITAVDMWSIGCVFFEILTKNVLFKGTCVKTQTLAIFQTLGLPSESDIPHFKNFDLQGFNVPVRNFEEFLKSHHFDFLEIDLIQQLLTYSPEKRITAVAALSHPFFDDLI